MSTTQDEVPSQRIAGSVSNALSTAISIPLVWPKATAAVLVGIIALGIAGIAINQYRKRLPPPSPSQRVQEMVNQAVQARAGVLRENVSAGAQRNEELQGVFDAMRGVSLPPGVPTEAQP